MQTLIPKTEKINFTTEITCSGKYKNHLAGKGKKKRVNFSLGEEQTDFPWGKHADT